MRLKAPWAQATDALFGEAAGLPQRPSSEERDTESTQGEEGWKTGEGQKALWGRATTIHQRLGTFAEVYWKFSPLSCSIKRKKEEEKKNMLQLPLSPHMLRKKQAWPIASLSHLH